MARQEDVENYLIQMDRSFEVIDPGMWLIRDAANIVITYEPPLVIFRTKLMEIPKKNREEFFKLLLTINASQMIHGAYGIEDNNVVIIDTLQVENLNLNEFQASLDAIMMAASQDYQQLRPFLDEENKSLS